MRKRLPLAVFAALCGVTAQETAPVTAKDIFLHLTRTIAWYQHLMAIDEGTPTAENLLLRNNTREFGKRTMQSSFAFAKAQAAAIGATSDTTPSPDMGQNLQQALTKATARVARLDDRLEVLDSRIARAAGDGREALTAERAAIAADLGLAKQMQSALKSMAAFNAPKAAGSRGLLEQIGDLEAVNPITESPANSTKPQSSGDAENPSDFHPENAGILTLTSKAIGFSGARKRVDAVREETDRLLRSANQLRAPLRNSVRSIAAESDRISSNEDAAANREQWLATSRQISQLSAQFKQLSAAMIPMSETVMSIQSARSSLNDWRNALDGEYRATIRYLIIRLSLLLGGVVFILLASAIWQRVIFKYISEPRRRRQFLLAKRMMVGASLALLFTLGFFSSFASVATLLGFITAGLALALQNVVLSAVAYFFLVGRYGLKVGDRVTVQGVTGQVIEVGLIRLFLMELAGTGTDMHPTGRVAVFANSVIFQPSALMKQAPGMDYAWHTVTATVDDPADYQKTRERLTNAVTSVYESYRSAIEQQHKVFERSTDMETSPPTPVSRAQFTESGLEIIIRYPVSMAGLGDIDERIVDRLIAEADQEPKLKFAAAGSPKIGQVV